MNMIPNMRWDFIASSMRLQVNKLRNILDNIEEDNIDCDYTYESIKQIEDNLRQIRKLCVNN